MKHIITIQDVARASKVSPTTVSNYLNGRHHEMRQETVVRIKKTIEELGYTPNSAARQLKTGHTPILGLLVPTVVNPYFAELAVAIDSAAQQMGYRVILCNTQRQAKREADLINELLASGVKGILATSVLQNTRSMKNLIQKGVAFVLFEALDSIADIEHVDIVSMNNACTTQKAVEHLAGLGHRRIVYVTATPMSPHRQLRIDGFLSAMQSLGSAIPYILKDEDIEANFSSYNDRDLALFGRKAARYLMQQSQKPTAIITLNDQIALGMMFSFLEQGIKIPKDISIVGIDDTQICSFVHPTLTSIRQPYQQIALTAVQKVSERLSNPGIPGSTTLFDPTLVARASSSYLST